MKIVTFLFDPRIGGPHICVRAISQGLVARGHEVIIAMPDGSGNAETYFKEVNLQVDRLKIRRPVSPNKLIGFLKFTFCIPMGVWRTRSYLIRTDADVVRINGALDIVPILAAWTARIPTIVVLNDTMLPPKLSKLLLKVPMLAGTFFAPVATRVAEHYGIEQNNEFVEIIHEPVDNDKFQPPRTQQSALNEIPVLGLVANWNPIKSQEVFVNVIRSLEEQGIFVRGKIVGDMPEHQKSYWGPIVENIQTTGHINSIDCLGFVHNPESIYQDFDLLLLTSKSEACPVCVLEAMASGIPVVSFDVGGVQELLGTPPHSTAGIVVPLGDVKAMIEAVILLLADRDKHLIMAKNGPIRVTSQFNIETCVNKHEQLSLKAICAR